MNNADRAYVSAAAALLDLPIAPEEEDAVVASFGMIMTQAVLITGFAIPDEVEAAPRFRPC